ncbi:MAG: ATP-binding protein, partial [Alphaproteobacteria bacterium]|nr:ATP-binding protein [Alphaproteobacteria bacterium]
ITFSPDGAEVVVSVETTANGGLAVAFRDQGPGMTENDLKIAMQPFGQVRHGPDTHHKPGSGLGLPLVKTMIELHNGALDIQSVSGQGTTARLVFPPERVIRR